jgi:hypothetical protein
MLFCPPPQAIGLTPNSHCKYSEQNKPPLLSTALLSLSLVFSLYRYTHWVAHTSHLISCQIQTKHRCKPEGENGKKCKYVQAPSSTAVPRILDLAKEAHA